MHASGVSVALVLILILLIVEETLRAPCVTSLQGSLHSYTTGPGTLPWHDYTVAYLPSTTCQHIHPTLIAELRCKPGDVESARSAPPVDFTTHVLS